MGDAAMVMIHMKTAALFLLFFIVGTSMGAVVPQVALCDRSDCPMVSKVGMGVLHLNNTVGISDPKEINSWINAAVDMGITLFDCSDAYPPHGMFGGSVTAFGQALKLQPGLREKLFVVAKMDIQIGYVDSSPAHLNDTLNWYLEKLGTDYVDLMMLHMPDSYADAAEVAALFAEAHRQGKARHFGVSDHQSHRFDLIDKKMKAVGLPGLVTHEIEFSVW